MRVLITGSTTWTDLSALRRELGLLPIGSAIITGDTPGVDALACEVAAELGLGLEMMKKNEEDSENYPEYAWKGLNDRMLETGIDLVLAFHPDYGKPGLALGTRHAIELAAKDGIPANIFYE